MKLIDALEVIKQPVPEGASQLKVYLSCGFMPLHLQTFLTAQLKSRLPRRRVVIKTGLYGDLAGNIERLELSDIDALVVVIEWGDLDPRLGIRRLGGWRPLDLTDIAESAGQAATRLRGVLLRVSRLVPTVVCMPTLPLPPLFWTPPTQAASTELHLHRTVAALAASLAEEPGIHIVNAQLLGEVSPASQRYDLKSDVLTGFPYSLPHASAVAALLESLIDSRPPKKGLITDLDDTLWAGILGEDGVNGVSWSLDCHTHMHGVYQQFLASLAGAGVLIGVASKNDSALVEQAFDRSDLLVSRNDIFPLEVHWSRKSESVKRILDTWNVGADSVVFIDDSPMEVAEVKEAFPDVECIVFPKSDYQGILNLLKHLREAFGKPFLTEDDALRLGSIRNASEWRDSVKSASSSSDELLRTAEASIVFSLTRESGEARVFELVNKTNQFNLNGKRFSEADWRSFSVDPATFVLSVSYKDKYGPLGTIAAILGRTDGRMLCVQAWVMSCRAFSRRIEYQCLKHLFETFGVDGIEFDYQATPRNGPIQEFFAQLLGDPPLQGLRISREQFTARVPALYHHVEETIRV
jgi:FkbH-like protein